MQRPRSMGKNQGSTEREQHKSHSEYSTYQRVLSVEALQCNLRRGGHIEIVLGFYSRGRFGNGDVGRVKHRTGGRYLSNFTTVQ